MRGPDLTSIEEEGLEKIKAISNKGGKQDFIDLYLICQEVALERLLELGQEKNPRYRGYTVQAVRAITFFADAEEEKMPMMMRPLDWTEVKDFLKAEVRDLSRKWYNLD